MIEITNDQASGQRFALFKNLKSRHCITTIDHGDIKTQLFPRNTNRNMDFLKYYFYTNQLLAVDCQHKNKIEMVMSMTPRRIFQADGIIFYRRLKNKKEKPFALASTTGDCPHIILEYENKNIKIVGVIHSGWRGTSQEIVKKAVELIAKNHKKSLLKIGLWSGICQNCYEVGKDVFDSLKNYKSYFILCKKGKWQLDLAGIIRQQLMQSGIKKDQIEESCVCSSCFRDDKQKPVFYSLRRGDKKNRNGVFIKA